MRNPFQNSDWLCFRSLWFQWLKTLFKWQVISCSEGTLITLQHTHSILLAPRLPLRQGPWPPTHSHATHKQGEEMPVLRWAAWGAWVLGFLPGDFPTWLLQEAELVFSQRRPNVRREEKAAGNKRAPEWESRGKVGPKILHRSFYRNGEGKMKVFLKLIHVLHTLLVPMPLHSFRDAVSHPRISLHC